MGQEFEKDLMGSCSLAISHATAIGGWLGLASSEVLMGLDMQAGSIVWLAVNAGCQRGAWRGY